MLASCKGHVYKPYCGSGGLFAQIGKNARAHGGHIGDTSTYDDELSPTARRLRKTNLAIRSNRGPEYADSFRRDLHKDSRAKYALASSPSSVSDWVYGSVTGAAA